MLVLGVDSILQVKTPLLGRQVKKSRKFLWPVIKISLFTSGLMLLIAAALLGPSFVAFRDTQQPGFLVTLGFFLFIPLAFTISCFNIFTGLYVILFNQSFGGALSLGADFIASKWVEILGLTFILIAIYAGVFVLGAAAIYAVQLSIAGIIEISFKFGNSHFSAIITVTRVLGALLLWLLLAGLNVFFNTALQLLFMELNTPVKAEQHKAMAPAPAVSI